MSGEGGVFSTHGMVTKAGKPFVGTFVNDEPFGQLSPAEGYALGIRAISAAIEAERDAGLVAYLKDVGGMDDEEIAAIIVGMREHRQQYDPPEGLGN